jgi:hypothetical protein
LLLTEISVPAIKVRAALFVPDDFSNIAANRVRTAFEIQIVERALSCEGPCIGHPGAVRLAHHRRGVDHVHERLRHLQRSRATAEADAGARRVRRKRDGPRRLDDRAGVKPGPLLSTKVMLPVSDAPPMVTAVVLP